jgi:hypothetical protein
VDDDLRNAFATLSAQISTVNTDLRANTALTAELTRSVADVRAEQHAQAGRIGVIEKHVFGSDPPPPPAEEPIVKQVSEHDGDIATVTGRVLAVESKVDSLTQKLGVDKDSGFFAVFRNANTKDLVKILTLIAAIVAAWKGLK